MTQKERVQAASVEIIEVLRTLEPVEQLGTVLTMLGSIVAREAIQHGLPLEVAVKGACEQLTDSIESVHAKLKSTVLS